MTRRFTPEVELIGACVRAALTGAVGKRVMTGEQDVDVNWALATELALREGVGPLFYRGLAATGLSEQAPAEEVSRLRTAFVASDARFRGSIEPALHGALSTLGAAGIQPVVLKGAALAYTAYPDPALRPMTDLDLLVRREELDVASRLLLGSGFHLHPDHVDSEHHLRPHFTTGGRVGLEIHHELIHVPNDFLVETSGVRARSVAVTIRDLQARALSPEDGLHLTCVHAGFGHSYGWYLLRSFADVLAIILSTGPMLDWGRFATLVEQSRTAGAVYWVLTWSREWLGAPVPYEVLSAMAPTPMLRGAFAAAIEPEYLRPEGSRERDMSDVLRRLLLHLSLGWGGPLLDRLAVVGRELFPPREVLGHLPPDFGRSQLSYAAYLLRPGRIARGLIAVARLLLRRSAGLSA